MKHTIEMSDHSELSLVVAVRVSPAVLRGFRKAVQHLLIRQDSKSDRLFPFGQIYSVHRITQALLDRLSHLSLDDLLKLSNHFRREPLGELHVDRNFNYHHFKIIKLIRFRLFRLIRGSNTLPDRRRVFPGRVYNKLIFHSCLDTL